MGFRLHSVTHDFGSGSRRVRALEGVTLSVERDEYVSIIGPSGCGKTTLLRIIGGLLVPSAGSVELETASGEPRRALVFQDHGLLPWCTVLENMALGLEFLGLPRMVREERARAFARQVGLIRFLGSYPHQLSAGMRQRVALARAFLVDADILLLDEPFGSLDAQTRLVLHEELLRIWRGRRGLVVHVTHDLDEALILSDRLLVLSGRPGTLREEIAIPLARPRALRDLERPEIVELKWRVWEHLRREVRSSLGLDPEEESRHAP